MKRLLALLAVAVVAVMCGCGGEEATPRAAAARPATTAAPAPDLGPYPQIKTSASVRKQLAAGAVGSARVGSTGGVFAINFACQNVSVARLMLP